MTTNLYNEHRARLMSRPPSHSMPFLCSIHVHLHNAPLGRTCIYTSMVHITFLDDACITTFRVGAQPAVAFFTCTETVKKITEPKFLIAIKEFLDYATSLPTRPINA